MVLNLITYAYLVVAVKIGCEHIRIYTYREFLHVYFMYVCVLVFFV